MRFFKTDKSGVIYMSRPFHSRITRQNRSKNERATPKGPKIPFLGQDAKGHKNQKIRNSHPTSFCHMLQGKKNYSNWTTRSMGLGGVPPGSTLYCVRNCIIVFCHSGKKRKKAFAYHNYGISFSKIQTRE